MECPRQYHQGTMGPTPDIVPITDFRRDAARIMERAAVDGTPVFVTQKGRLAAVVLPRKRYDELLALAAEGARASGVGAAARPQTPSGTPVAGFAPTRPRHRVETLYGPADPELAAFYASEGIWTEDQGGPRPPRPWERIRAAEGDDVQGGARDEQGLGGAGAALRRSSQGRSSRRPPTS